MDLLTELKSLVASFARHNIDYALCGGLALAVYAKPRATLDIDIIVEPDVLARVRELAEHHGFSVLSTPMSFRGGAVQIHRLTKIEAASGEHMVLDLLLVTPQTRTSWDSRTVVDWGGQPLKVLTPKGLILLKSLRKSGQDLDDIAYLKELIDEN